MGLAQYEAIMTEVATLDSAGWEAHRRRLGDYLRAPVEGVTLDPQTFEYAITLADGARVAVAMTVALGDQARFLLAWNTSRAATAPAGTKALKPQRADAPGWFAFRMSLIAVESWQRQQREG